jgi:signal transduction histidine kinase
MMRVEEMEFSKFASHLEDVRKAERSAIACEIHDDLGQILAALKIDTGLLKRKFIKDYNPFDSNDILLKFDSLENLVNDTVKTFRRIMNGLRPEQLELLGLKAAIKEYLRDFEARYQLNCELKYAIDEFDIDQRQTLAIFRIMQEAMTNISKYAKATVVTVELTHSNDKLVMEITDNGIGFDLNHCRRTDSYGMIGMRERVSLLKGELTIASNVGDGTRVKVEMPYK